ncbi:hypothetical protein OPV22_011528 [Ensete ventricosum]|uniref:Uncharacterized protein n=1 Tax=Ensete ventricosum TaxID=4639 RepID=A0AAV8RJT6_ENSVE|nr:hypothetical protein OPV22_011528 [Ensete ventricosum]
MSIFDCILNEVTAAAASAGMSHRACRVDTAPRLAQWRIDAFSSCTYRKSDDPFNQDRPLELVSRSGEEQTTRM